MEQHFLNALDGLMKAYKAAPDGNLQRAIARAARGLKAEFSQVFPEKIVVFDTVNNKYRIHCKGKA